MWGMTSWELDPGVLISIAVAAGVYGLGWRRLRRRSRSAADPVAAAFFGAGLLVVALALMSPVGALDQQLFSLHMTEHLLLTLVAPPLLLLGRPLLPVLWALPRRDRRGAARLARLADKPVVSVALFVLVFGAWHIPALYDAAQGPTLVHYLEHGTVFITAMLFWWPVLQPSTGPRVLGRLASILYFTPPMLEGTLIGALLTFASHPLYRTYVQSPIEDQQLAGLIMWVPGGMVYAAAVLWQVALLLRDEEIAEERSARVAQVDSTTVSADDPFLPEKA